MQSTSLRDAKHDCSAVAKHACLPAGANKNPGYKPEQLRHSKRRDKQKKQTQRFLETRGRPSVPPQTKNNQPTSG